jgi:hypothetical protein
MTLKQTISANLTLNSLVLLNGCGTHEFCADLWLLFKQKLLCVIVVSKLMILTGVLSFWALKLINHRLNAPQTLDTDAGSI